MWIDQKYIGLIQSRLDQCTKDRSGVFNFRCPFCGDSKTNQFKKRGYLFEKGGKWSFYCHNCHKSLSFDYFLKHIDPVLHTEYKMECLKESGNFRESLEPFKTERTPNMRIHKYLKSGEPLRKLKKISQLPIGHPAKVFCENREIPTKFHAKLFYTEKFKAWTNSILPDKFDKESLTRDEQRIVIPFIDEKENLFGFQGRQLDTTSKGARYRTIMLQDRMGIFGLDSVDPSKTVYLFEGPFDSMFVPNSLGYAGSGMHHFPVKSVILVYDNEPRNKEIVTEISNSISKGFSVVIWPDNVHEKDVNDMILAGYTQEKLVKILEENTFHGLGAEVRLAEWKRVDI